MTAKWVNKVQPFLLLCVAIFFIQSCTKERTQGRLYINSADPSVALEIFKISDDTEAFSLTGEVIGRPNTELSLPSGTYLVMADCSHELIIIRPNETVRLNIGKVKFLIPDIELSKNSFSIQCDRFKASIFRQQLNDVFELNILEGKRNMLVNMKPFKVDIGTEQQVTPLSIDLAALRVGEANTNTPIEQKYFVSVSDETVSLTKPVKMGHWFIGLAGRYQISINGSEKAIELLQGQARQFNLGKLLVEPPKSLDMAIISKVRGYPYVIKVNGTHELLVNETYSLLPGEIDITLDQSNQKAEVEIYENETTKVSLKSVTVALDCAPWEWECLGRGEIMVYRKGENYPFMDSITDIPILYIDQQIQVGIAGSRDIRMNIPKGKKNLRIPTGTLILEPKLISSKTYVTDLVRLAAGAAPLHGKSLDISNSHLSKMRLIAGKYKLETYISNLTGDNSRNNTYKTIYISENTVTRIKVPFYIRERRYKNISSQLKRNLMREPSLKKGGDIKEIF
jgi:hypothetical protein